MPDSQTTSDIVPDKSLLSEYRDYMIRKKDLARDESDKEHFQQLIELVDDLDDLFEHR